MTSPCCSSLLRSPRHSYVKLAVLPLFSEIPPSKTTCYITGYAPPVNHLQLLTLVILIVIHVCTYLFLLCVPSAGGGIHSRMRQAYLPFVDHQTYISSGWWESTVKATVICPGEDDQSGCNMGLLIWKTWKYSHAVNSFSLIKASILSISAKISY